MRLKRSRMDPVCHVLCEAWATHLFTFATSDSIYCLYPVISLRKRQMVLCELFRYEDILEYDACVRSGMVRVRMDDVLTDDEFQLGRHFVDGKMLCVRFPSGLESGISVDGFSFCVGKEGTIVSWPLPADVARELEEAYFGDDSSTDSSVSSVGSTIYVSDD